MAKTETLDSGFMVLTGDNRIQFATISDTASYLATNQNTPHYCLRKFFPILSSVELAIISPSEQYLELRDGDGRRGSMRRYMSGRYEGGVSVMKNFSKPNSEAVIIVEAADWEDPLLDRGLTWVRGIGEHTVQSVGINRAHGLPEDVVAQHLGLAIVAARNQVEAVLAAAEYPVLH